MTAKAQLLGLLLLCLSVTWALPSAAVEPDEILDDPRLEERARELSKIIRCLVCQNEAIDSSNADLARDLRILVRERLVAGDSDQDVLDYLVARYGDFVLLEPPMHPGTYLLWFGPLVLLLIGGAAVAVYFARQRRQPKAVGAAPLSVEEQERLERLLASEDGESR